MDSNFLPKKVSIVVPCRNEEKYIGKCIQSIINQTYGLENIEILIIDGMSNDGTCKIINKFKKDNKEIKLIRNDKQITPVAINLGIKQSKGDIVILFGAHSYMDSLYVEKCVEKLSDGNIDCVGGRIINLSENDNAKAISLAMSSPFGVGNALFRFSNKEQLVDTVAFGAYNRKVFDKIGYFDEKLIRNQDDEFNLRLSLNGGKILLCPEIISYYYIRSSYKKLWNQYFQYGFWKVKVIKKHKKPASFRHIVPMLFVLGLILGSIFSIFSFTIRVIYFLVILLYFIMSIVFSIKINDDKNKRLWYRIVFSFMILHLSYGFGFLEGIIVFNFKNNSKYLDKNSEVTR